MLNGRVEPGDTVAVVGAGPIGLATIMTAKLHTPGKIIAIDLADSRLEKAIEFGADVDDQQRPRGRGREGDGADGRPRCRRRDRGVGVPETFELCTELIRPGGRVANVGVHGKCATLHLEKLWIRDVMITTGLVDTSTTPKLLKLIEGGQLDPTMFATHRFSLDETEEAYDVFGAAAETHALKVVLSAVPVETRARRKRRGSSLASSLDQAVAEAVDVILRDGGTLRLRPPLAADADALLAFFDGPLRREPVPALPRVPADRRRGSSSRCSIPTGSSAAPSSAGSPTATATSESSPSRATRGSVTSDTAEMAFAVADSEQGRGIGTRLLEQLASRARRAGISSFVADVLASNAAALAVFADAGFELVRELESGRGRAALPDRPDRHARVARRGARPHRRRRLAASVLRAGDGRRDRRLAPARLDRRRALPQHPRRRLRAAPPSPSTSRAEPVAGVRAYRSIGEIPDTVDLAVICLPGRAGARRGSRRAPPRRARALRDLGRLRRDRRGGPRAPGAAARARSSARRAARRPELPRHRRPGPRPERDLRASRASRRPDRLLVPERRARAWRCSRRPPSAGSASRPSSRSATRPTSRRTTCSSGGRTTRRRISCCSTSSRSATRGRSRASPAGSRAGSRSSP